MRSTSPPRAAIQAPTAALPDLPALAAAEPDDVIALWAGLGYYARARNLHKAAQACVERHAGELPRDFDALAALPGIGRSTAGAILAQAHGMRYAILDGELAAVGAALVFVNRSRRAAAAGPPRPPAADRLRVLERMAQLLADWSAAPRHFVAGVAALPAESRILYPDMSAGTAFRHDRVTVEVDNASRITSVLVVDENGRLLGALNTNDLMRAKVI